MRKPGNIAESAPANLIENEAHAYGATIVCRSGARILVEVPLQRADGKNVFYALEIDASAGAVKVKEERPEHLPACCPERHINRDGTFCMGWHKVNPLDVTDIATAQRWWDTLLAYLRLQERAGKLGKWPNRGSWAHGNAVEHQHKAECCAVALGAKFVAILAAGHLHARSTLESSGHFLHLFDGKRRLYSVWKALHRVSTLRQRCFCGSGLTLHSCADHAMQAADLAVAVLLLEEEERRFWRSFEDETCCGSVTGCPLAANLQTPARHEMAAA
jgi:hypothetical protein